MKTCTGCQQSLADSKFNARTDRPSLRARCIDCERSRSIARVVNAKAPGQRACMDCLKVLPLADFPSQMRAGRVKILSRCKPCNSAYDAARYQRSKAIVGGRPMYWRPADQARCDAVADAWRYPVTFGLVGARLAA